MKTIHRLKAFIEKKGISLNAFDASIGAANGYIGKTIKNEASVGSDMLEKIFSVYPELDINWLLLGKKRGNTPNENTGNDANNDNKTAITTPASGDKLHEKLHPTLHPTTKSTSKSRNYTTTKEGEYTNILSEDAPVYNLGVPKVIVVNDARQDNIVYVPVKARAGYLSGFGDEEFISTLPTFRLPGLNHGTFRMFEVEGVSMAPNIVNKDRVIGEWVNDIKEIRENRVYIVVCTKGVLIKRVSIQGDKLILKSDTIAHRHEYQPIELKPKEVKEIWLCMLKISTDFSEPTELYHRVTDLELQMADVKKFMAKSSK